MENRERKTDVEKLKGILEEFRPQIIEQAIAEFRDEGACRKSIQDFDDPGPEVEVGDEAAEDVARMERIIFVSNLLPVHYLEEGSILQRAVARVVFTSGSPLGTGFLVGDRWFMTNNHVIPSKSYAGGLRVQFNYQLDHLGNPQSVDTWQPNTGVNAEFYTDEALDFTLIELHPRLVPVFLSAGETFQVKPWDPYDPYRYRQLVRRSYPGEKWGHIPLKDALSYAHGQHLNIIQHPQGRRKEVALQHNEVTNVYDTRVRYTTDTEPGSSGSPVFNNEWDLVALHHAAGTWEPDPGVWVSNEGMRIDKIVAHLRDHASQEVLSGLGI